MRQSSTGKRVKSALHAAARVLASTSRTFMKRKCTRRLSPSDPGGAAAAGQNVSTTALRTVAVESKSPQESTRSSALDLRASDSHPEGGAVVEASAAPTSRPRWSKPWRVCRGARPWSLSLKISATALMASSRRLCGQSFSDVTRDAMLAARLSTLSGNMARTMARHATMSFFLRVAAKAATAVTASPSKLVLPSTRAILTSPSSLKQGCPGPRRVAAFSTAASRTRANGVASPVLNSAATAATSSEALLHASASASSLSTSARKSGSCRRSKMQEKRLVASETRHHVVVSSSCKASRGTCAPLTTAA
mmetsp:Transcript_67761/g.214456  ORF Transcript_67761/g.214456 Transcript_67761/m.214456 type:complete len:308 (+) Transcript_67761:341-1264(+)